MFDLYVNDEYILSGSYHYLDRLVSDNMDAIRSKHGDTLTIKYVYNA